MQTDVQGREVQAEDLDLHDEVAEPPVRQLASARITQARPEQVQVRQQLVSVAVAAAVRAALRPRSDEQVGGASEPAVHECEEASMRLVRVAPLHPVGVAERRRQLVGTRLERCGHATGERDGQVRVHRLDAASQQPDRHALMLVQRCCGDGGRHVRVAVAVAPDPGSERQRTVERRDEAGVGRGDRGAQLAQHARHDPMDGGVEPEDRVADLVDHGRGAVACLVGEPQGGDLLAELAREVRLVLRRERLGVEPSQQVRSAHELGEHAATS
jgi:hypothetical protein